MSFRRRWPESWWCGDNRKLTSDQSAAVACEVNRQTAVVAANIARACPRTKNHIPDHTKPGKARITIVWVDYHSRGVGARTQIIH
jgi:hypothetical protein